MPAMTMLSQKAMMTMKKPPMVAPKVKAPTMFDANSYDV
jgi:hypothetical protein